VFAEGDIGQRVRPQQVGRPGVHPADLHHVAPVLDERTREVIGVMPPDFAFPSNETDLWIPRQMNPESQNFGGHGIPVIARLRTGATVETRVYLDHGFDLRVSRHSGVGDTTNNGDVANSLGGSGNVARSMQIFIEKRSDVRM